VNDEEQFEPLEDDDLLAAEDAQAMPSAAPPAAASPVEPADAAAPAATSPADAGKLRYSQSQARRVRDVLSRLYAARRTLSFYPMEHPASRDAIAAFADVATSFHSEGVDLRLTFYEGEILLGDQLMTEESVTFDQLVRDMTALGAGALTIKRGTSPHEYESLIRILSESARQVDSAGGMQALAKAVGLEHVDIGPVVGLDKVKDKEKGTAEDAKASYGGALAVMREIDRLLRNNRQVPTGKVKGAVRSLVDNVLSNRYAMLQLTGLRNYDEYTFYHSANVAILSLALGSVITTDYRFLSSLGVGSLLHDIGKLSVELDILNKPGALTPDEWGSVRQHPITGSQIIATLPGVDKSAIVTILEHHMRYDGSGYPERSPKRRQHLASRIVAVADSYDAMTSKRSYSAARVQDEAMAMLAKSAGSSLDAALVRLFIRLLGVYPPRSAVRLSEGQIAVVLQPSESDPGRPLVRIIANADGDFIDPLDMDLSAEKGLDITGCIDPRLLNIEVDAYL
jgi:HD-GYP domain-containing protein (c-di-GMP phosphodiesterase class II)